MTDKLYTQSEVDTLIQAANEAALREVFNIIGNTKNLDENMSMYRADSLRRELESLIPQPSALARHDEKLKDELWELWIPGLCEAIISRQEDDVDLRLLAALNKRDEELKAEFAAMMEKIPAYIETHVWSIAFNKMVRREKRESHFADAVRALIPTTYASALDRRVAEARLEFINHNLIEPIHAAVAQGWCIPPNTSKPMDVDLALAIVNNVLAELRRAVKGESDDK